MKIHPAGAARDPSAKAEPLVNIAIKDDIVTENRAKNYNGMYENILRFVADNTCQNGQS